MSPHRLTPDGNRKSNNPFLDPSKSDAGAAIMSAKRPTSPATSTNGISFERPVKRAENGVTETLFDLSLQDKPSSERNLPPRGSSRHAPPTMNRRVPQPKEERRDGKPEEKATLNIFESPVKSENRRPTRPRRNSETSMIDARDEERRRRDRERRRRDRAERGERPERSERERSERDKDGKSRSSRRQRKPQGMDIIDQLDVTGLYGPGMIHHDGPFDACNPHRNKQGSRAGPMSAFPQDSLNNAMGGSGPVKKSLDFDAFHGRTVQGYSDWNETKQQDTANYESYNHNRSGSKDGAEEYNAKENIAQVHGSESLGLGTSTFFEGTVASRKDVERAEQLRRESEDQQPLNPNGAAGGGLSRKRSIAQKIRGMSRPRPGHRDGAPVTTPGGTRWATNPTSPEYLGAQSAGGQSRMQEHNPFFSDASQSKKDGTTTAVAPVGSPADEAGRPRTASSPNGRARAPSSPRREFYRVRTQDDDFGMPTRADTAPTGLIGRVKSLRSKKRPERFGGVPPAI
ncbi:MAG: hypothetical protein Q9162_002683 [Coniocarpon cinnabarinum]